MLISAIKIIFLLGFLVTIHEGGHFLMAKLFKIKVEEFSIGFGPKIFSKKGKETVYSISLIPFGGYVRMLGEEERSEDPRSFNNSKVWKRMLVVLAGPIVNICFALIVYFVLIASSGTVVTTEISGIIPEAEETIGSYLQIGDKIVNINGTEIKSRRDMSKVIMASDGNKINITVLRNGQRYTYEVEPTEYEGVYILGVEMATRKSESFQESFVYSANETADFIASIGDSLKQLFTGKVGVDQMTGPDNKKKMVAETDGLYNFIYLLALVSLSLGVTNLLPIPALDGGRFLILIVEGIRRKPLSEEMEYKIISIGFTFIIVLSLYVTYNDIFKIFNK